MKKRLLVIDFDQTVTGWDDNLSKARADKLAKQLNLLHDRYNMDLVILTMANKSHVFNTIVESKSGGLVELMKIIQLISVENRRMIFQIDRSRNQSTRKKNDMVQAVTNSKLYNDNPDYIRAYKKTNELMNLCKQYDLPPQDVFFLDDNHYNIHFASFYGFRTFLVDNHPNSKRFELLNQLKSIEKMLSRSREKKMVQLRDT